MIDIRHQKQGKRQFKLLFCTAYQEPHPALKNGGQAMVPAVAAIGDEQRQGLDQAELPWFDLETLERSYHEALRPNLLLTQHGLANLPPAQTYAALFWNP